MKYCDFVWVIWTWTGETNFLNFISGIIRLIENRVKNNMFLFIESLKYLTFLVIGRAFRDPIEPMNKKPTLNLRDTLAENIRSYTESYLLTLGHDNFITYYQTSNRVFYGNCLQRITGLRKGMGQSVKTHEYPIPSHGQMGWDGTTVEKFWRLVPWQFFYQKYWIFSMNPFDIFVLDCWNHKLFWIQLHKSIFFKKIFKKFALNKKFSS